MSTPEIPRGARVLETSLWLPRPLEEVFDFFADARNLQELTPPWLRFEIRTEGPIEMRPGALIDYRIRLHGVPLGWRTEIGAWEPPTRFVDQQLRGPYRLWHHEHRFEPDGDGTRVIDRVTYAAPGGALADRLLVRRDLERIFRHRHEQLRARFGGRDGARTPPILFGPAQGRAA